MLHVERKSFSSKSRIFNAFQNYISCFFCRFSPTLQLRIKSDLQVGFLPFFLETFFLNKLLQKNVPEYFLFYMGMLKQGAHSHAP